MANKKRNKRKERKAKSLIFVLGITAVVFVVATYAWFVGITEVKVNSFNVTIKSSDGLFLSLNGEKWDTEITLGNTLADLKNTVLNNETPDEEYASANVAYADNSNSWLGVTKTNKDEDDILEASINPVSTEGTMNTTTNTLNFFSKTSLTTSAGGYTLRADAITRTDEDGNDIPEDKGVVAFDLYIKNKVTGATYTDNYDEDADEAIYLTKASTVGLAAATATAGGDGLQNSLRVAFMQLGRVEDGTSVSTIQGIGCTNNTVTVGEETEKVTGLCNISGKTGEGTLVTTAEASNNKTYAIWEPNDKIHTQQSLDRFVERCKQRCNDTTSTGCTGDGVQVGDYNSTVCTAIANDTYYNTYVVRNNIVASDKIDIYDGHNGYTANTSGDDAKLYQMSYYTDTDKMGSDGNRDKIFGLAASSITKVRVYIYLEGQDLDNFDVTSENQAFLITFGFTKDQFEPDPEVDAGDLPHDEGE